MEDRAIKMLANLIMAYDSLLRIGVPKDKALQAIAEKIYSLATEDPELFEEIANTGKLAGLLDK